MNPTFPIFPSLEIGSPDLHTHERGVTYCVS